MSKYTPGPWKVEKSCKGFKTLICRVDGEVIVRVDILHSSNDVIPGIEEAEANAELIAKAPEMAEEIQQLKAEIEELNTVIKLQREEAVRHEKRSMDQDKRIRELENSLNDLCEIINEYDILNSDDEIGVVMPNKDREKMRKARELLRKAMKDERLDELRKRVLELEKENLEFRDLLWWNHGCDHKAIYGDDGEMQCNQCLTDFKRNEPSAILTKFRLRTEEGREILRQQELLKQALGEK